VLRRTATPPTGREPREKAWRHGIAVLGLRKKRHYCGPFDRCALHLASPTMGSLLYVGLGRRSPHPPPEPAAPVPRSATIAHGPGLARDRFAYFLAPSGA
jgi:hypothetical protein